MEVSLRRPSGASEVQPVLTCILNGTWLQRGYTDISTDLPTTVFAFRARKSSCGAPQRTLSMLFKSFARHSQVLQRPAMLCNVLRSLQTSMLPEVGFSLPAWIASSCDRHVGI